jgi:AcrR family transcriptional regulator
MRKPNAETETNRLDHAAWVAAGLDLLAERGVDAVRVEVLARRLSITKGSFYWHFKDRAGLLEAMLARWKQNATGNIINRLERSALPQAGRLRELTDLPTRGSRAARGASVELAIRLWAKRDAQARRAVAAVDQQRLEYIAGLAAEAGAPDAAARAYLIYAYILAEALIVPPLAAETKAGCEAILDLPRA